MNAEEIKAIFDRQAAGYDQQWQRMAPIRHCLHYLVESLSSGLPETASVLCVGAGTGAEIVHLAQRFPRWTFTAVDPSGAMLAVCRKRAESEGISNRCRFHEGYVATMPVGELHDVATCFLVSQFLLDRQERIGFFRDIAVRLRQGGKLFSTDLARGRVPAQYESLLADWFRVMNDGGVTGEALEKMRLAYANDVAVLSPELVESIIADAGFASVVQFFQAGLIHGWQATRA